MPETHWGAILLCHTQHDSIWAVYEIKKALSGLRGGDAGSLMLRANVGVMQSCRHWSWCSLRGLHVPLCVLSRLMKQHLGSCAWMHHVRDRHPMTGLQPWTLYWCVLRPLACCAQIHLAAVHAATSLNPKQGTADSNTFRLSV